jgi:hypothetical protein
MALADISLRERGRTLGKVFGGGKDDYFLALFAGGFSDVLFVGSAEGLLLGANGVFDVVEVCLEYRPAVGVRIQIKLGGGRWGN